MGTQTHEFDHPGATMFTAALLFTVALSSATDPALMPIKLDLKPGKPLTVRSLVLAPAPLKGTFGWTIEPRLHRSHAPVMALSPDGKTIATGGMDGTVRLWHAASGELKTMFAAHDSYVYGIAFSPGGKYLATGGSYDGTAKIWDVSTGLLVRTFKDHASYVAQLVWSADGSYLFAVGGSSGDMSTWDTATGKKVAKYAIGKSVRWVSPYANGTKLAVIGDLVPMMIYDMATGRGESPFGDALDNLSAAWSPDGKLFAIGNATETRIFDAVDAKETRKLKAAGNRITWSADGKKLAAASHVSSTIAVFDTATGTAHAPLPGLVYSLFFDASGTALSGADYYAIGTWSLDAKSRTMTAIVADGSPPHWTAGRPTITGVGAASTLKLWDAAGQFLHELKGHTSTVAAFAWSPDGKQIATASYDNTVRIWDATTGDAKRTLAQHIGPATAVGWSPDGKQIASGSHDKTVIVWDAVAGTALKTLTDHTDRVAFVEWSPGTSGHLATGANDGDTHLYETKKWTKLKSIDDTSPVRSAVWSTDGKQLVVGHADSGARIVAVPTAKRLANLLANGSPPDLTAMAWSPNLLATGYGYHKLNIWAHKTGQKIHTLETMAPVQQVAFGSNGSILAVASGDRTCRFFDPTTGKLRGSWLAEADRIVAVSVDGHIRAEGKTAADYLAIVQTEKGQEMLSAAEFAEKFKWKNDPTKTKFTAK